jgi:CRISPR-associated endonuclease/helicase Cas3
MRVPLSVIERGMTISFRDLFVRATGRAPYRYQKRFAEESASFDLLSVPTGAGKTATAILGWLYRRRFADDAVKKATPRRLVYCLPMRTLVEQTDECANDWLATLGIKDIRVHKLLGGDVADDWMLHPENDAILVGTQDMLLSRALNRGYAEGRFQWPIDFGLLNNDCLWVFDEVQLMAAGVSTSAQLAGLREKLSTFGPSCRSVWMSATLEKQWLDTVDFRDRLSALTTLRMDDEELTTGELGKRMTAKKILKRVNVDKDASDKKYGEAVAKAVLAGHEAGSRTLIVMNTVNRAQVVFEALSKQKPTAELMLIHSRFRPVERGLLNEKLTSKQKPDEQIIVATQVVEAGVDISARLLVTELAPWPSLVQRFGRCHRYGSGGRKGGEAIRNRRPRVRAGANREARGSRRFATRDPGVPEGE